MTSAPIVLPSAPTVTRDRTKADGTINIHTTYYLFAGHKSADFLISDRDGNVLARLKIVNGQNAAVMDDYQKFAWYCADEVGKVLRPRKREPVAASG